MCKIIKLVVDKGLFFEMGKGWGCFIIIGFVRFDGWLVVIFVSDLYYYGGGWMVDVFLKVNCFVDFVEMFYMFVVNFVDNLGFVIGIDVEKVFIICYGCWVFVVVY